MIDIETVANTNTSAVIQVAMVRFDWDGNVGDTLVVNLDLDEQVREGLDVNASTLSWWARTNATIFNELLTKDVLPVKKALKQICDFINFNDYIWCHATFDIPILNNLLHKFGFKTPWAYMKNRDIRTLIDLSGLDLSQYPWDVEKTHDALEDCVFQIKYCTDAYKLLRDKTNA